MNSNFTPVTINIYNGAGSAFVADLCSFGKNRITFGSAAGNDICIDSAVVSEFHGYFQLTTAGWVVFDNNSANGIVIAGSRRKDAKLLNGMEICISDAADKLQPVVTIVVDINEVIATPIIENNSQDVTEPAEAPKKKSKAPRVVGIILGVLFALFIIIALLCGLGGWAIGDRLFDLVESKNKVGTTIEQTEPPLVDDGDIITDIPEITEPEEVPVELPERVPSSIYAEQYILAKCDGTYATLTLYELEDGVWVEKMSTNGRVGKNGITENKREGDGCTPAGEFDLTFCCGVSEPDTNLDFRPINKNSVWVDDVDSYYYNTLQSANDPYRDWDSAEPMMDSYFSNNRHNYCINIAANGDGYSSDEAYPGYGSVITLCGKNDALTETQGCVDISGGAMSDLLSHLDSYKSPVIIIYE